jgi:hypothetical protein
MAQPMGMMVCLISLASAYSVENGAPNRSKVKFSFDIHLKMARPIGGGVRLCFIVN